MLGRKRDRLAEPEPVGLVGARVPRPTLALVGDENRRLAGLAHDVGEGAIGRRQSGARVDQKEHCVRTRERGLRLRPHAARQGFGGGFFETGGVDHPESQVAKLRVGFTTVAGDAWRIVDQSESPADQPIE